MKLKELKALVKEEYDRFMYEQEDEEKDKKDDKEKDDAPKGDDKPEGGDDKPKADKPKADKPKAPKKPEAPKVKVGGDDLDIDGEENPEETLRAIYDMLKDFFEGDKEPKDGMDMDMDNPSGAPKPPAGMDMPGGPSAPGGASPMDIMANKIYENVKNKKRNISRVNRRKPTKAKTSQNDSMTALQERFKKLANIIK